MSWICPHQDGEYCKKRQLSCEAGAEGCVLEGRINFVKDDKNKKCYTKTERRVDKNDSIA